MKKSYYLLLANYLYMAGVGLLSPVYALYVLGIGGSALTASASWSLYLITAGILMIIFGNTQDKSTSIKKYIVAGYAIAAVSTLLYLIINTTLQLFILQFIHAIGIGLLTPALRNAYTKVQNKQRRSHEWSLFDGGIFILQGTAALAGGLLLTWLGFTQLFILMAAIQILSTLVILKLQLE
jgi:DHA1 family multidrug resistance protein-like MFS transporter